MGIKKRNSVTRYTRTNTLFSGKVAKVQWDEIEVEQKHDFGSTTASEYYSEKVSEVWWIDGVEHDAESLLHSLTPAELEELGHYDGEWDTKETIDPASDY